MVDTQTVTAAGTLIDGIAGTRSYDSGSTLKYFFGGSSDTFFGNDPLTLLSVSGSQADFAWEVEAEQAYDAAALVADVDFVEETTQADSDLSLFGVDDLFADNSGLLGLQSLPGLELASGPRTGDSVGIGVLDTDAGVMTKNGETGGGSFRAYVVAHEIGHSLGLGHPVDTGNGSSTELSGTDLDDPKYTVMSTKFTSSVTINGSGGVATGSAAFGFAASFMAIDIAALQHMYGADNTALTGATTYTLTDAGTTALDLDGSNGSISIGRAYYSIWDAGGTDEIVYDGDDRALINLNTATLKTSLSAGTDDDLLDLMAEVEASDAFDTLSASVQNDFSEQDRIAGGFFSQIIDGNGDADDGGFSIANGAAIENASGGDDDDILVGNALANTLNGGAGHDSLFGGAGADTLNGELGNDELFGGDNPDTLNGGSGDDVLHGGLNGDILNGDNGDDEIFGGANGDVVNGGAGADDIFGEAGNDVLNGGDNPDDMEGGAGDDELNGGLNGDIMSGGDGDDELNGGANGDVIDGDAGADEINGEAGNDVLSGGDNPDTINGGDGADDIDGGANGDILNGGAGGDDILGGANGDVINGDAGDDVIDGESGNDRLSGGADDDSLTGGLGTDTFVFALGFDADIVTDFNDDVDTLELDDALWTSSGTLTAQQVVDTFMTEVNSQEFLFDFGGGDTFEIQTSGVASLSIFADDISIV